MNVVISDGEVLPDIVATGCQHSFVLKGVDFRIPCGKCLPCQKKRRSDWSFRLEQEYNGSDSALFITLTYNDVNIPKVNGIGTLNKRDVQNYIKRLRNSHVKYVSEQLNIKKSEVKNVSKPIRYYLVGEYGSKTRRPHYHILLFNYEIANLRPITTQWKNTQTGYSMGHVDIGTVTGASINYVTKYMFKPFGKNDWRVKPFSLMSKKPMIGEYYLKKYGTHHIQSEDLTVKDNNGNTRRLPKAFLRKLFINKEDRLEISKNSYDEFKIAKEKEYKRILKLKYNNDVNKYIKSVASDNKRRLASINLKETL